MKNDLNGHHVVVEDLAHGENGFGDDVLRQHQFRSAYFLLIALGLNE